MQVKRALRETSVAPHIWMNSKKAFKDETRGATLFPPSEQLYPLEPRDRLALVATTSDSLGSAIPTWKQRLAQCLQLPVASADLRLSAKGRVHPEKQNSNFSMSEKSSLKDVWGTQPRIWNGMESTLSSLKAQTEAPTWREFSKT